MIGMASKSSRAAIVLLSMLALAGCSDLNDTEQRMLSGGAIGAGVGAVGTVMTGGCVACGAAIGGAVGTAGGFLSDQMDKLFKSNSSSSPGSSGSSGSSYDQSGSGSGSGQSSQYGS